jgi:hypothetical protein
MIKWQPFAVPRVANWQSWRTFSVRKNCKGKLGESPTPLFQDMRVDSPQMPARERTTCMRAIFARQPFGELERLVTQKLLDVVKNIAREELASETWLRIHGATR